MLADVTFEAWALCRTDSDLDNLRLSVGQAMSGLAGVKNAFPDILPPAVPGGYTHVAIRARQRPPLQLSQWTDLHERLADQIAVSKITVWAPYAFPGSDSLIAAAEQAVRETGCEPRSWSDWDGEVKISQQPSRRLRGPLSRATG